MLPPLLSLLLDCFKKTDQAVVSISLGALVHLIEVGGHQFSECDRDMLKSIRDASYTAQPLELLNALSFENLKGPTVPVTDLEVNTGDGVNNHQFGASENGTPNSRGPGALVFSDQSQESGLHMYGSEGLPSPSGRTWKPAEAGLPSPSGRTRKPAEAGSLQRTQTIGQRFVGNMMDSVFLRSFTSKLKDRISDASVPSSPIKVPDTVEPDTKEEESPLMATVRGKCITQLLLLGTIDSIQVLREASYLQSGPGETANMDVHRVLELHSPVIVKVLNGMCFMNNQIFKEHLREIYSLLTKLVLFDLMDVRGALGDLFRVQLKALLP